MKKTTNYLLISLVVIVILYDILALLFGGGTATVSYQIWLAGRKFFFLPYAFGVLGSHFFAPNVFKKMNIKLKYILWIVTSIIILIFSICYYPSTAHPFAGLVLGLGVGLLWAISPIKNDK